MVASEASAEWRGDLKAGAGSISSASGAVDGAYSFDTRFKEEGLTNPEELIAAAHAGCFSMALAAELATRGLIPESITTTATVYLEGEGGGWSIKRSHLNVTANVPGAGHDTLQEAAQAAKQNCPVSKVLRAEITMTARQA